MCGCAHGPGALCSTELEGAPSPLDDVRQPADMLELSNVENEAGCARFLGCCWLAHCLMGRQQESRCEEVGYALSGGRDGAWVTV